MLAKTGHNFYAFVGSGHKNWNPKYAPIPDNYYLIKNHQIPFGVTFDVVLSQSRLAHHDFLKSYVNANQIPYITLEHTFPYDTWSKKILSVFTNMKGHENVFISDTSRKGWGFDESNSCVIEHAIDCDLFRPAVGGGPKRVASALSVANEWVSRDQPLGWKFYQKAITGLPARIVGDNPGMSLPTNSVEELASIYAQHSVFVNTSQISPIPMSLLEAMSSACICISTATCQIPDIVKDGENGFLADTPEEMRGIIAEVLSRPEDFAYIGEAARQTIIDRFGIDRFVKEWNEVFYRAADTPFLERL